MIIYSIFARMYIKMGDNQAVTLNLEDEMKLYDYEDLFCNKYKVSIPALLQNGTQSHVK
jgi:hypothetical protein